MKAPKSSRRDQERRSGKDRRRINPPSHFGIEKRDLPEGRSPVDRRAVNGIWLEFQPPS